MADIKILGDKDTTADKLGFQPYVETLVAVIENIQTMPYTIGIFGKWGSGKTSFMRMMEGVLDKRKSYLTVWFNAWKFSRQQEMWSSLFETIATTLKKKRKIGMRNKARLNDLLGGANYVKLMSSIGKSVLIGRPDVQGILESFRDEKNFESVIEFEKKFSRILKDSDIEKLIVFIDDLDRCLDENAINILESIKLFLNSERCIFILGIDREKIENAIARKFGEEYSKENASDYIKKIIQLPFNIPSLRNRDVFQFLGRLDIAEETRRLVREVITALDRNPREMKRFLDILAFRRLFVENIRENENIEINQNVMVILLTIEYLFPEFYQDMVRSFDENTGGSSLLQEIEDYLLISDQEEMEKKLEKSYYLRKYGKNSTLLNFLKEKKIGNVFIEPYLFIASVTSDSVVPDSEIILESRMSDKEWTNFKIYCIGIGRLGIQLLDEICLLQTEFSGTQYVIPLALAASPVDYNETRIISKMAPNIVFPFGFSFPQENRNKKVINYEIGHRIAMEETERLIRTKIADDLKSVGRDSPKIILLIGSLGEGLAAGAIPALSASLKTTFPELVLIIVGILPRKKEDETALVNAARSYEIIMGLKEMKMGPDLLILSEEPEEGKGKDTSVPEIPGSPISRGLSLIFGSIYSPDTLDPHDRLNFLKKSPGKQIGIIRYSKFSQKTYTDPSTLLEIETVKSEILNFMKENLESYPLRSLSGTVGLFQLRSDEKLLIPDLKVEMTMLFEKKLEETGEKFAFIRGGLWSLQDDGNIELATMIVDIDPKTYIYLHNEIIARREAFFDSRDIKEEMENIMKTRERKYNPGG